MSHRAIQCIRAGHGYYTFHVDDYSTFLRIVSPRFTNQSKYQFVWRGVENPNWQLTSSISRSLVTMRTARDILEPTATSMVIGHLETFIHQLRGLTTLTSEHHELCDFIQDFIVHPPQTFLTFLDRMSIKQKLLTYELFSMGQHHGLLTPFLDWTSVPAIALFFAFSNPTDEPENVGRRAVYALNKTLVEKICPPFNSHGKDALTFLGSMAQDNPRIIGQGGLFSFAPTHKPVDEWIIDKFKPDEYRPILIRFLIRNKNRDSCLSELDQLNINARVLFPDKIGASLHSNYHIRRKVDQVTKKYKDDLTIGK